MAYTRKPAKADDSYQKLKSDIAAGTPETAYLFYGEESYLREYYLGELRRVLVPAGFEEFNHHCLEGRDLTAQALTEMAEAMPMMAERTMIVVTDWDLFKLNEDQREKLVTFLNDVPPYCCVVFVYDTVEYKPNRTMKKLCAALDKQVRTVEFRPADNSDLVTWIARRFKALGKEIDRNTAEYLIFICGGLMTGLVQEIHKIGTYAKGKSITQKDIDAVADPVLDAVVFDMTNAITAGDYDRAARLLDELLKQQEEPFLLLGAIGKELRKIYTARLAIDTGRDKRWLMDLWGYRSDYPVKLLLGAAKKTTADWCADAVKMCQVLDRRLKSERGIDAPGELKLLLVRLGVQRK